MGSERVDGLRDSIEAVHQDTPKQTELNKGSKYVEEPKSKNVVCDFPRWLHPDVGATGSICDARRGTLES